MPADQEQIERVILEIVTELHPDHLTPSELVQKVAEERDERDEVAEAIRDLKGVGLLNDIDTAVEPTLAAIRAVALLTL
jgi:SOS response regulatory protein OraA/RecX